MIALPMIIISLQTTQLDRSSSGFNQVICERWKSLQNRHNSMCMHNHITVTIIRHIYATIQFFTIP